MYVSGVNAAEVQALLLPSCVALVAKVAHDMTFTWFEHVTEASGAVWVL